MSALLVHERRSGNIRYLVLHLKNKITDLTVAQSSSQAAVMSKLPDDILMALPRRATVSKALRRHRKKVTDAANKDTPLPAIPKTESFADIVVFDSGPGDNRLILISCHELVDGLARSSMWLADGTFNSYRMLVYVCTSNPHRCSKFQRDRLLLNCLYGVI